MYENFAELLRKHGKKASDVAEATGIRSGVFSDWKAGRYTPKADKLAKIADYFGVSVDYLLTGGEIVETSKKNLIPVLGYVAAGVPITAQENVIGYEEITNDMARRGEWFALVVKGDSMNPRIYEGDLVICREQPDAENGDLVVALINGDEACVKKLIKFDNGIALQSLNPNYPLMTFTEKQIESLPVRIIGKVEELRARL